MGFEAAAGVGDEQGACCRPCSFVRSRYHTWQCMRGPTDGGLERSLGRLHAVPGNGGRTVGPGRPAARDLSRALEFRWGYACPVNPAPSGRHPGREQASEEPEVEVVIEIPRGSFLKRGSTGHIDFISPLPCPFNYGSVPCYLGLEGDLLDAVVLGPRLSRGTRTRVKAWGAVTLTDRGMSDDKLVCDKHPVDPSTRRKVLRFFRFYAKCKGLLNFLRRRPGRNACEGWCEAREALARARPRDDAWHGPPIEF